MNDQHITAIATIVQDILLVLNAFLIAWYLYETHKIRRAAQDQVAKSQELVYAAQRQISASLEQAESASRPAIVVTNSGSTLSAPMLENIGNGPAIEVKWCLLNSSFAGVISLHEAKYPRKHCLWKILSPSTKRAVRSRRMQRVSNVAIAVFRVGNILQAMPTTRKEVAIARLFRLEFDPRGLPPDSIILAMVQAG